MRARSVDLSPMILLQVFLQSLLGDVYGENWTTVYTPK